MSDLLQKCGVCGALIDEEDLFCANCGTEAPHGEGAAATPRTQMATHNFTCDGCGASMSYDASAQTLRCPFCGSEHLTHQKDAKMLRPNSIVPFEVDQSQALETMRGWLGNGFWRPGDLAASAVVTKLTAVYVPYWVFQARTFTYWTADSNQTPPGARGDWVPKSGEHRGCYSGLLIGASGALTPSETSSLCSFDLAKARPSDEVSTDNHVVEQFRVQRKYARPLARQGVEQRELQACQEYVRGRCRNVKVNVRMEGLSSEPMLLPVWIMAYKYGDRVFRFLINGQTGHATGQAPISWTKVIAAIAVAVLIALLVMLSIAGVAAFSEVVPESQPGAMHAMVLPPPVEDGRDTTVACCEARRKNGPRSYPTELLDGQGGGSRPAPAAHVGHGGATQCARTPADCCGRRSQA
jgi:hypothetical protein